MIRPRSDTLFSIEHPNLHQAIGTDTGQLVVVGPDISDSPNGVLMTFQRLAMKGKVNRIVYLRLRGRNRKDVDSTVERGGNDRVGARRDDDRGDGGCMLPKGTLRFWI
jgi:hypothetical protein